MKDLSRYDNETTIDGGLSIWDRGGRGCKRSKKKTGRGGEKRWPEFGYPSSQMWFASPESLRRRWMIWRLAELGNVGRVSLVWRCRNKWANDKSTRLVSIHQRVVPVFPNLSQQSRQNFTSCWGKHRDGVQAKTLSTQLK